MLKKADGFSLLELMLVIALIGVVLAWALPSYQLFLVRTREELLGDKLVKIFGLARDEAILQHKSMIMCGSDDQTTCSSNWSAGQIIFSAENQKKILYRFPLSQKEGVLFWRSSLHRQYVQFLETGLTDFQNGTFWFCDNASQKPVWVIRLNHAGRARMESYSEVGHLALPCA